MKLSSFICCIAILLSSFSIQAIKGGPNNIRYDSSSSDDDSSLSAGHAIIEVPTDSEDVDSVHTAIEIHSNEIYENEPLKQLKKLTLSGNSQGVIQLLKTITQSPSQENKEILERFGSWFNTEQNPITLRKESGSQFKLFLSITGISLVLSGIAILGMTTLFRNMPEFRWFFSTICYVLDLSFIVLALNHLKNAFSLLNQARNARKCTLPILAEIKKIQSETERTQLIPFLHIELDKLAYLQKECIKHNCNNTQFDITENLHKKSKQKIKKTYMKLMKHNAKLHKQLTILKSKKLSNIPDPKQCVICLEESDTFKPIPCKNRHSESDCLCDVCAAQLMQHYKYRCPLCRQ